MFVNLEPKIKRIYKYVSKVEKKADNNEHIKRSRKFRTHKGTE